MLNIQALLDPGLYDHPVRAPRLIETHISWVVLTGEHAYKVKKPLDLGFLDFSTLERRAHFCHEELRLNRRLAPRIYLEVVPIHGTERAPRLRGGGPAIEYAVKMRQFPQDAMLDHLLAIGRLGPTDLDALADRVGRFHAGLAPATPDSDYGTPERVRQPVAENFAQVRPLVEDRATRTRLDRLRAWSEARGAALATTLEARRADGMVRECHGDMHLGNMALVDGELVIFDGIEFNPYLRWIDVASELAFLFSDLVHRGRPDYAWRVLNGYLSVTGDYAGLALLDYYQAYRVMVRAKVSRIRLSQPGINPRERELEEEAFSGYLAQAEAILAPTAPTLVLARGVSGSGKTRLSRGLAEALGAVHLRSDVERKRLHGLAAGAASGSALRGGIYTPEASERTLARLVELAGQVLAAGLPVIVDATFLERHWREPFRALAGRRACPYHLLDLHVGRETLLARVAERERRGGDASEAGTAVVEQQLAGYRELDPDEQASAIRLDGASLPDLSTLARRLRGTGP